MNKLRMTALLAAMLMAFSTFGCGQDEGDDADGGGKSTSQSSDENDSENEEEEETTKRTRKKKAEEETTEEETEASQGKSCLVDDAELFSKSQTDELNDYICSTADNLSLNICVYVAGSADADMTDEETAAFADERYDEMFGADTDGVFYYLDMSGGKTTYDYISTSGIATDMYLSDIDSIFDYVDQYLPKTGDPIVPDDVFVAVQMFCDQLETWSIADAEPEPETKPEAADGLVNGELVPGVKLRMTLDEIRAAIGDNAYELAYLYDGYDCETYAFPVSGALGVDMEGFCFFDINRETGTLQTCGYHLGDTGDMKAPDYPYSEAELKAGYTTITDQLLAAYGGELNEEPEYDGITRWYQGTTPDGDQAWAVYGMDMWAPGSGINEITVSLSIPDEERFG